MVELQSSAQTQSHAQQQQRNVFKMQNSSRMGGSMPAWGRVETAKEDVMQRLVTSGNPATFDHALALQSNTDAAYSISKPDAFGMGDVVDMVNPLQHIPVVGHIYREVTGDEIKSIGKIIGGGIFGGPAGLASGLINTVIEQETGEDLAGNAMNMVLQGKRPNFNHRNDPPTQRLNNALDNINKPAHEDLPAALLAFSDHGRGAAAREHKPDTDRPYSLDPSVQSNADAYSWRPTPANKVSDVNLSAREDITVITLSDLPHHSDL